MARRISREKVPATTAQLFPVALTVDHRETFMWRIG
jgi:hypothetical protein